MMELSHQITIQNSITGSELAYDQERKTFIHIIQIVVSLRQY